jgi:UDPglucose 6-dehydrogenase
MEAIWEAGGKVRAYDPVAMNEARRLYGEREDLILCDSADHALEGSDVLMVITEWSEFRSPDFERIRRVLRQPVVFDGRNLYDPEQLTSLGVSYYSIGRSTHHSNQQSKD